MDSIWILYGSLYESLYGSYMDPSMDLYMNPIFRKELNGTFPMQLGKQSGCNPRPICVLSTPRTHAWKAAQPSTLTSIWLKAASAATLLPAECCPAATLLWGERPQRLKGLRSLGAYQRLIDSIGPLICHCFKRTSRIQNPAIQKHLLNPKSGHPEYKDQD